MKKRKYKCCCYCCSVNKLCLTLCDPMDVACQALLTSIISQSLFKVWSIALLMLSNYLIRAACFSFCIQSFPASGSFPISQLFSSGGQSIGASGSASVLSMNIQG